MSKPRRPSLFDLPLDLPEGESAEAPPRTPRPRTSRPRAESDPPAARGASRGRTDGELPLFPDEAEDEPETEPEAATRPPSREPATPAAAPTREEPESPSPPAERPAPSPAGLGARWWAGGLDLLFHAVLALALAGGSWLLGATLDGIERSGLLVFLAVFSFLYTVIPLAFWGRTPGMTWVGLVATGGGEEGALTFGQTALRWLGAVLTVALLGLPTLLAVFGGRSLTDLLSGSRTWRSPRFPDR